MSTAPLTPGLMSVEEYLHTSFDGADREYLDGEVVERNMGNNSHSLVQGNLIAFFHALRKRTGLYVRPELRHKVTRTRYRIPDVAVFDARPTEQVPSEPPLIAIEVLSPDDRMSTILTKLAEYRNWGVEHIWLVDPEAEKLFAFSAGLLEVSEFTLPAHGVTLTKAEIFEA